MVLYLRENMYNEDPSVIRHLLDSGDHLGQTPLHLAAIGGHASTIAALIVAGALKTRQNLLGQTPLHCSIIHGNFNAMALLLGSFSGKMALCNCMILCTSMFEKKFRNALFYISYSAVYV